jgi:hypothetical protein
MPFHQRLLVELGDDGNGEEAAGAGEDGEGSPKGEARGWVRWRGWQCMTSYRRMLTRRCPVVGGVA